MSNKTLNAVIRADVSSFNRAMNSIGATAEGAAGIVVSVFATAVAGVIALEKSVIGTASSYEDLKNQVILATGSIEEGTKAFEKWKKIAAESQFDTKELLAVYANLVKRGGKNFAEEQTLNVAAAAKGARMSLDAASKSMGAFILKLKNVDETGQRGVLTRSLISGQVGGLLGEKGVKEMLQLLNNGADVETMLAKINDLLKEQGELGLKLGEESFTGKMKKLLGQIDLAAGEMGGPAMEQAKKLFDGLGKAFKDVDMSELKRSLGDLIETLVILAPLFKNFLEATIIGVVKIIDGINILTMFFGGLIAILGVLWNWLSKINKLWQDLAGKGLEKLIEVVTGGETQAAATQEERKRKRDEVLQRRANKAVIDQAEGQTGKKYNA